ncbi:MAG: thiamine pyrophosphate-binding protein [Candidatus Tritonobacter lacicola]|nr:thiamine pyrophosphate-binding protein [Candidatus Tritonobacter lacicola]
MKISEYLIKAIQKTGTRHVFGIQGDYVLNFYDQLCKSPLKVINTCDEQGAGFAADAYARMTGFGAVCVTYGVGGLKLANSTAQAFAELSPVLVVSGAPGMSERKGDPLLHHKVRSFETQLNVFREMTSAQAVLDNPETAADEIDRVIHAIYKTKRPGYIELPRDMVQVEAGESRISFQDHLSVDKAAVDGAIRKVMAMLAAAKNPIVIAGAEIHRFGLQQSLLKFLDRSQLPFVTGILSKSVVSENHPQFVGVYAGAMSPEDIRQAVEEADCVIAIGPLITDLSTGIFTQHIDAARTVALMLDDLIIGGSSYPGIGMKYFLEMMIAAMPEPKQPAQPIKRHILAPFVPEKGRAVTMERLIACINTFLSDDITVIAEPGDPLFGGLDLRVHDKNEFMSCSYYASLGFSVPASIGVQFAAPDRRPLVLVGDGSFQMTGMELSVSARYGLNPIVVILNNGGYGTFRHMIDGDFNDIQPWQYADVVRVIGAGKGYTVSKEEEFVSALEAARSNNASPTVIDVRIGKYDCSERLKMLTDKLKKRVK